MLKRNLQEYIVGQNALNEWFSPEIRDNTNFVWLLGALLVNLDTSIDIKMAYALYTVKQ